MKLNGRDRRDEFLEEFVHCYDGVVRRVRVQFLPSELRASVHVTLSVRRPNTQHVDDGWVNVRLAIERVEEFVLRDSPAESCRVLSSGLQIGVFDHLYFFDFAPYSVEPSGVDDYRRSGFYVAGRSFSWQVGKYSELVPDRKRRT